MRFRLRTLLIAITVVGLLLARYRNLRQQAEYHRRQSSMLVALIAKREGLERDAVAMAISNLIELRPNEAIGVVKAAPISNNSREANYSLAVSHQMAARSFDGAACFPWTLFSKVRKSQSR